MQQKITTLLASKSKTISAEIIPPRNGSETEHVFEQIAELKKANIDFISVTKGAGGSLRGGTLPIAHSIQSQFNIPSLAHFTCRDHTKEEVENILMDHHYFGVKNILALRGDPPDGQPDYFQPAPNRHTYAFELVEQIKHLNDGKYISRKGFDNTEVKSGTKTDFCIGVAVHPEAEPFQNAVDYFVKKIELGAEFGITQMIYNADNYEIFMNALIKKNIKAPVLPGLRILTQKSSAERMIKKFGINIPSSLVSKLSEAKTSEDAIKVGIEFSFNLCDKFFKAGAKGIHLFVMNDTKTADQLIKKLWN